MLSGLYWRKNWNLLCNIYVVGNCKITASKGGDDNSICTTHEPQEIPIMPGHGLRRSRELQLSFWYSQLSTEEMFAVSHQPQNIIIDCKLAHMNNTLCEHFRRTGGTRIFSPSRGVCYSFNLREYFPEDLKESLKQKDNSSLEKFFEGSDKNGLPILQQQFAGPIHGLEFVFNLEGNYFIIPMK